MDRLASRSDVAPESPRHCRDSSNRSTDINEEILVYGDDAFPFMSSGPGVSDGSRAVEKHADSVHVSLGHKLGFTMAVVDGRPDLQRKLASSQHSHRA